MRGWHQFWQGWNKFWQTPVGTALAIVLFVAATVLAFACPAFMPYYLMTVGGLVISLGVGATINGFRSMSGGGDFWEGFANYINEHWAQDVAIGMALAMVSFGISQAVQAISSAAAERSLANVTVEKEVIRGENIVGSKHNIFKPTQDEVNINIVYEYIQDIKTGKPLKPIEVYEVSGRGYFIADGHHRYVASRFMGIEPRFTYLPPGGPIGLPNWSTVKFVINFNL